MNQTEAFRRTLELIRPRLGSADEGKPSLPEIWSDEDDRYPPPGVARGGNWGTVEHIEAMYATMLTWKTPNTSGPPTDDLLTEVHKLRGMVREAIKIEAKAGRWLGWLQGVAMAAGVLTPSEALRINKES